MEVAFGTVGVASIIIQLTNSIQQLCDFISSVNCAPASVQRLQDELQTLRAVLLPIEQYRLERLDICPLGESLKLCQNSFDRLNETVQGWQQNLALGGSRRTWGRLCIVMGKKKVEEFKYELDSAKLLVLLALQPIYHKIQCQDISQAVDLLKQLTQPPVALHQSDQTQIAKAPGSRICSGNNGRKRLHLKHSSNVITPRSLVWSLYHICCNNLSKSDTYNILYLLKIAGTLPELGIAYSTLKWSNQLPDALQKNLDNLVIGENYQKMIRILMPGFVRGFSIGLTNSWGNPLDLRLSLHNVIREDAIILEHVINGDDYAMLSEFQNRTAYSHDTTLYGGTLLHYAACNGRFKTCQLLLELGLDPNAVCSEGRTPLYYCLKELASRIYYERETWYIINHIGTRVEWRNKAWYLKKGDEICPINDYFETVKTLINGGSDPTTIQVGTPSLPYEWLEATETALGLCICNDNTSIEIMRWLLHQNEFAIDINHSSILQDVKNGVLHNRTKIRMLLRAGVNLHLFWTNKLPPSTLLQAAARGYNPQENVDAWLRVLEEEGYNLYDYGRKEASLYTVPYRELCEYQRSEVFDVNGPVWYEAHHVCTEREGLSVKLVLSDALHWFGWGAFDLLIFCDLNTPGICENCWYPNASEAPYETAEYYCYSCREFDLCRHCYERYNGPYGYVPNSIPRTCRFSAVKGGEHNYVLYERELAEALPSKTAQLTGEELALQLSEKIQALTFRLFTTLFSISRWLDTTYMTPTRILKCISFRYGIYIVVLVALSFFFAKSSLLMVLVAGKLLQWFMGMRAKPWAITLN